MNLENRTSFYFTDHPWFHEAATEEILRKVNHDLADGFDVARLTCLLRDTAGQAIRSQLENAAVSRRELRSIIARIPSAFHLHHMVREAQRAGAMTLAKEPFTEEDFAQIGRQAEELLESRISGRAEAWESVFYPRMLGLFAAAFGLEPSSQVDRIRADSAGPTVTFIHSAIRHVIGEQRRLGYAEAFPGPRKKLTWTNPALNTVGKKVNTWMREHSNEWKARRDEYRHSHFGGID